MLYFNDVIIGKIEPPHPKRGWGFLNFFSLNKVDFKYFSGYPR